MQRFTHWRRISLLVAFFWAGLSLPAFAADDMLIFSDQRHNGWADWSWVPRSASTNSRSGTNALNVIPSSGYQALYFRHNFIDTGLYTNLTLWVNGGANGGQSVGVSGLLNGSEQSRLSIGIGGKLPTNSWLKVTLSLATLGVANKTNFNGIQIWSNSGNVQSNFFVDDITLVAAPAPALVRASVMATQAVRMVDYKHFGINQAAWDGYVYSAQSVSNMNELNIRCQRWPGGSWGDGYHWTNEYRGWGSYSGDFMRLATNTQADAFIIVNYGSGSPEEAAFGVRMFNVTNQCRFKYWEVGNENFGSWETDVNTNAPWLPHDPWTYAKRFTNYFAQMKAVDPTIKIGAVVTTDETSYSNNATHFAINPRTSTTNYGWTPIVLDTLRTLGVTPDFVVMHKYAPDDGDTQVLLWSKTWADDARNLRQMLIDYLGVTAATNVTIESTENGPGGDRQRVSLVGGLFYADSVGQIMQTEINSRLWWDNRNGVSAITNSDPALYGWRTNASGYFIYDEGIVWNAGAATNRYPQFYTAKLLSLFARSGDTVVRTTSDYPLLATYSVRRTNNTLGLLVINKSSSSNLTVALNFAGWLPATNATLYSYGIPQDDAARTGLGSWDVATNAITTAGINFTNTFAPYSASVLIFNPAPPPQLVLPSSPPGKFVFQLQGQSGARYVLQSCTNLSSAWVNVATNTLSGTAQNFTNNLTGTAQFWRAQWLP